MRLDANWIGGLLVVAVVVSTIYLAFDSSVPELSSEQGRSSESSVRSLSSASILQQYFLDQGGLPLGRLSPVDRFRSARTFLEHHRKEMDVFAKDVPLKEFVAHGLREAQPGVILGQDDILGVVTGVERDDEGRACLQILESDRSLRLESVDRLRAAGFTRVWTVIPETSGVPLRFGSSRATVDRVLIPLGLLKPAADVASGFRIENTGERRIVIGRIEPSCSCTSIEPANEVDLAPGEFQDFDLHFTSGDSGSSVYHVGLTLFEKGTGISQELRVTLCGSVLGSYRVSPLALDFGAVDRFGNAPVKRTVSFTESESDPFEITSVRSEGESLELSWVQSPAEDGLRKEYVLTAVCDGTGRQPGTFHGKIIVNTTSVRRPRAVIEFKGDIRSVFRAVPEVAAFGMVPVGQPATEQLTLTALVGQARNASVVSCPDWVECKVTSGEDGIAMTLTADAVRVGYQFGKLRVRLESEQYSDEVEIPCSLFVQEEEGKE